TPETGVTIGLRVWLFCWLAVWFIGVLFLWPRVALAKTPLFQPGEILRRDLTVSVAASLMVGIPMGLARGFDCGFAMGLVTGLWVQAWPRVLITNLLMARRGWLPAPLRLSRFLRWTYSAGLLRRSGLVCQFCHPELQRWLDRNRAYIML